MIFLWYDRMLLAARLRNHAKVNSLALSSWLQYFSNIQQNTTHTDLLLCFSLYSFADNLVSTGSGAGLVAKRVGIVVYHAVPVRKGP